MAPIRVLGLLCFEPKGMWRLADGSYAYTAKATWIDIPRDDAWFYRFLGLVLTILEWREPPKANPACQWCNAAGTQ